MSLLKTKTFQKDRHYLYVASVGASPYDAVQVCFELGLCTHEEPTRQNGGLAPISQHFAYLYTNGLIWNGYLEVPYSVIIWYQVNMAPYFELPPDISPKDLYAVHRYCKAHVSDLWQASQGLLEDWKWCDTRYAAHHGETLKERS
jgi:hypothetical protein